MPPCRLIAGNSSGNFPAMANQPTDQTIADQPKSIDIRSTRCIALAMRHRFEGESLTRTVERILERYDAQYDIDSSEARATA